MNPDVSDSQPMPMALAAGRGDIAGLPCGSHMSVVWELRGGELAARSRWSGRQQVDVRLSEVPCRRAAAARRAGPLSGPARERRRPLRPQRRPRLQVCSEHPVKSGPSAAASGTGHVPSTPRGPSEWPFPTNSPSAIEGLRSNPRSPALRKPGLDGPSELIPHKPEVTRRAVRTTAPPSRIPRGKQRAHGRSASPPAAPRAACRTARPWRSGRRAWANAPAT